MKKTLLYTVLGIITLSSCSKAIIDENPDNTPPEPLPISAVYNNDVKDVMYNYCVTCHGGAAPSAGLDLTTYNSVKNATQSGQLINRMNSATSPMPASGLLPQEVRNIIDKWAEDGYPEN